MAERERKDWRELCNAAREANDPAQLLKILQELNKALKRESQLRRDVREATVANESSGEVRFSNYWKGNDSIGSNHDERKIVRCFQSATNQGPLPVPETSLKRQECRQCR
jgi:hypothetical protein